MKLTRLGHLSWWQKTKIVIVLYVVIVLGVLIGLSIAISAIHSDAALSNLHSLAFWLLPSLTIIAVALLIRINKRIMLRGNRSLRSSK